MATHRIILTQLAKYIAMNSIGKFEKITEFNQQ